MTATLEYLITTYGYWALFAGTFLEGETVLVMAGFAANRGYLELPWVIVVAFLGSFAGDQFYFYLGRCKGKALLARRPVLQARVHQVYRLMARYHTPFLIGFRFMTGLRTLTPIVIGMTPMSATRFLVLNLIGAVLWSVVFGVLGFVFGNVLQAVLDDIHRYEFHALAAIILLGVVPWVFYLWRQKRRAARAAGD